MSHKLKEKTHILVIGALGVVFGDIGTSPLYAIKVCFSGQSAITPSPANVLGVVSLIFWSLMLVVSFKYALVHHARRRRRGRRRLRHAGLAPQKPGPRLGPGTGPGGLFGSALLYGDGLITPVISVLSALEGLEVATTQAKPLVLPLTCVVLFLLFAAQSHGTGFMGKLFGPVMIVWFGVIAWLGLMAIAKNPEILAAVNPVHAEQFFLHNGLHGFFILGARSALHYRLRSPLCGHGAFRGEVHPHLLVSGGAAGSPLQLLRPGRPDFGKIPKPPPIPFIIWSPTACFIPW